MAVVFMAIFADFFWMTLTSLENFQENARQKRTGGESDGNYRWKIAGNQRPVGLQRRQFLQNFHSPNTPPPALIYCLFPGDIGCGRSRGAEPTTIDFPHEAETRLTEKGPVNGRKRDGIAG
ncbi:hypothetical protein BKA91DRAFT_140955 [Yarrowia lipolytica]|nr:hypothetical protein BKA91DRAFT_140955 [Yarrowia lipolytica]KAE8170266.1 hypothetical protein BKA90DRAFT_141081 [Yarrowia lipolytica]RMI95054.1 hypothetical protein BD777DRAFT_130733 [Yarrowia lipolytica]